MTLKKIQNISRWRRLSIALWNHHQAYRSLKLQIKTPTSSDKSKTLTFVQFIATVLETNPAFNRHVIGSCLYQKDTIDVLIRLSHPTDYDRIESCYFRDVSTKTYGDLYQLYKKRQNRLHQNEDFSLLDSLPFFMQKLAIILIHHSRFLRRFLPDVFSPTVSLSNVGSLGVNSYPATISPILTSPIYICLGQWIGNQLEITISVDHRVFDGLLLAELIKSLSDTAELWSNENDQRED